MSKISQQQVKHWHEEKEILAVRMEISSDHTTVGSEARKHCYLWWKIWLALTGGKQAVLVLSCKNRPLLPQNGRWCMLCTRISECGGLPEVNRLDKKHKVRKKKQQSEAHFMFEHVCCLKSAARGWCEVKSVHSGASTISWRMLCEGAPQVNTTRSKRKQSLYFPCRGKFTVYCKFRWSLSKTEQITLDLRQPLRR